MADDIVTRLRNWHDQRDSWQTLTEAADLKVLLSPRCNVRVARYLYDHGGTAHWKGSSGAYNRKAKNEGTQNP